MIDFRFKTEAQYLDAASYILLNVDENNNSDYCKYNELMDEFMYFCEVSGSGK